MKEPQVYHSGSRSLEPELRGVVNRAFGSWGQWLQKNPEVGVPEARDALLENLQRELEAIPEPPHQVTITVQWMRKKKSQTGNGRTISITVQTRDTYNEPIVLGASQEVLDDPVN